MNFIEKKGLDRQVKLIFVFFTLFCIIFYVFFYLCKKNPYSNVRVGAFFILSVD